MPIGGIPSQEDIEKAEEGRRKYEDGEYTVVCIAWHDDENHTDNGDPIFVPQGGDLVARCRMLSESEEDGPPFSVRPGKVLALARAFGVDVAEKEWPDIEKDSSRFLRAVERAIGKATKEIKVTVKGGWVSDVPGMSLPRDEEFQLLYVGCSTKNEEGLPSWIDMTYGRSAILEFRVIGDLDGDKTPYDGYTERVFVSYGFSVDPDDPDMPIFETDEKGTTNAAVTCYNLIFAMCPDLLETTKWGDPSNIMPEWDAAAMAEKIILKGETVWSKKAAGVRMWANTIKARYKDKRSVGGQPESNEVTKEKSKPEEPKEEPSDVEESPKEVVEESSLIDRLYKAIRNEVKGKAFDSSGKLTKAGGAWCKKHLRPLLEAGKIKHNKLKDLTDDEVRSVLRETGHVLDDLVENDEWD